MPLGSEKSLTSCAMNGMQSLLELPIPVINHTLREEPYVAEPTTSNKHHRDMNSFSVTSIDESILCGLACFMSGVAIQVPPIASTTLAADHHPLFQVVKGSGGGCFRLPYYKEIMESYLAAIPASENGR